MLFQSYGRSMKCLLCGSKNKTLIYRSTLGTKKITGNQYLCTSRNYGEHGPIYKCNDCNLVFIVDDTSEENIIKSYTDAQDPVYVNEMDARIKTFSVHLKRLAKYFPKAGRLLDVGAYTGVFLNLARKVGWKVEGIEPSKWAVGQAGDLSIKNGILRPDIFQKASFDVVTIWDVIEHFADPVKALFIVSDYLKPNGILAMTTMDVKSVTAKILGKKWPWYMRMHRVYFSKQTITRMLKQCGFEDIKFNPHIRYLSIRYLLSKFTKVRFPLDSTIIPVYLGDLFDVYARKPKNVRAVIK